MTTAAEVGWTLLALLGHGLLWIGLINRVHAWAGPRRIVDGITYLSFAAAGLLPLALASQFLRQGTANADSPLQRGAFAYGALCFTLGAASFVAKPLFERRRHDRRVLRDWQAQTWDVSATAATQLLMTSRARLLGAIPLNEAVRLSVDRKQIAIPRLPEQHEGLTICHLSDLHITGDIGQPYFDFLVASVNQLRPDAIAITGDIIESEQCRSWLPATLGKLSAPLGVYFILGNHDLYIDHHRTQRELIEAGLVYVDDRWVHRQWQGGEVRLVGNERPWIQRDGEPTPPPLRGAEELRIALSHSPDQFAWCREADADLVLAGHTHGGQVQLPWLGVIASPSVHGAKYACGEFLGGKTVMHVTRGVGGKTPLRWRCPPEAAFLELTRG